MQIFPKEMMPPHYFEPVMHNGALKWAVLLGNEITIVPTNASELKRCLRFKMDKVPPSPCPPGFCFKMDELAGRLPLSAKSFFRAFGHESFRALPPERGRGGGFFAGVLDMCYAVHRDVAALTINDNKQAHTGVLGRGRYGG